MKRALRLALAALGIAVLAVAGAWVALYLGTPAEPAPPSDAPALPAAAAVPGAAAPPFPKQTENHCGAYSLALALRVAAGATVTGAELVPRVAHEVSWSEALSGTMPWRIAAEARARGVPAAEWTARGLAPGARLLAVKRHIARGRPVVLLIESERMSQHYVLALGYGPDGVRLYDPNFEASKEAPGATVDENGPEAGNRTLADAALLGMWAKGGIAGLYTWWYVPLGR